MYKYTENLYCKTQKQKKMHKNPLTKTKRIGIVNL